MTDFEFLALVVVLVVICGGLALELVRSVRCRRPTALDDFYAELGGTGRAHSDHPSSDETRSAP